MAGRSIVQIYGMLVIIIGALFTTTETASAQDTLYDDFSEKELNRLFQYLLVGIVPWSIL